MRALGADRLIHLGGAGGRSGRRMIRSGRRRALSGRRWALLLWALVGSSTPGLSVGLRDGRTVGSPRGVPLRGSARTRRARYVGLGGLSASLDATRRDRSGGRRLGFLL